MGIIEVLRGLAGKILLLVMSMIQGFNITPTPTPSPPITAVVGDFDIYLNGMYTPCKIGVTQWEIQAITNTDKAGAWLNNNILYVYDHVGQTFSGLQYVKIGDIIEVKHPTKSDFYTCYLIQRGMDGNTYNYPAKAEETGCKIMLQTCDPHYPIVMYVYFK